MQVNVYQDMNHDIPTSEDIRDVLEVNGIDAEVEEGFYPSVIFDPQNEDRVVGVLSSYYGVSRAKA